MEILKTIPDARKFSEARRAAGRRVGLVPTMGYLHEGHLSLVRKSRESCGTVILSIFVNPVQFTAGEDLERYPCDLERDCRLAAAAGVDAVFTPTALEMYPGGYSTYIDVLRLSEPLCGNSRPGHFRGVATVVAKLFNIIQPEEAFFGQKDYQQVAVLKRLAEDLNFPIRLVTVPTVREADGLAMSSRNVYLNTGERRAALVLFQALQKAGELFVGGERTTATLEAVMRRTLEAEPLCRVEYAEVRDARTLEETDEVVKPAVAAIAARIGQTRLIDNLLLEV